MNADPKMINRSYENGRSAARNGASRDANPFQMECTAAYADAWEMGWLEYHRRKPF